MYELRYEDNASYFNFLRVPPDMFDDLLGRLGPPIAKQDTSYLKALEPGLKLAMTMRHFASGDRYASMTFDFRVPHNTMSVCVFVKCARPSSMGTRTSASSVLTKLKEHETQQ